MKIRDLLLIVSISMLLAACAQAQPTSTEPMMYHSAHDMHMMHNVATEEEFVVEMIPHHQEAVDTSKIIAANTQNEELRVLTLAIIEAQEREISMMNEWVTQDYDGGYPAKYQNMMPDLASLSGVEQDDAYLQGMIEHHEMAVMMAEQVLALNPTIKVAAFANEVIDVQTAEIKQMKELLS